jgi:uncharacterized protein YggE
MSKSTIINLACGAALCLIACGAYNRGNNEKTTERIIEVTGSAEKEVTPNEVFYSITLTEYRKGKKKITMEVLEERLIKKAIALGIKKQDVQLENTYSYGYYYDYWYWNRHKREDYYSSKTFTVKLEKPETIEKLLDEGDSLNYTSAHISRFENSNRAEYRDSLKIQALKAARRKAEMLLNSVGENISEVISITEVEAPQNINPYYGYYGYGGLYAATESNVSSMSNGNNAQANNAAFKDLKLRYEIKAVFRINNH